MNLLHDIPKEILPITDEQLYAMHGLYTELRLNIFKIFEGKFYVQEYYDSSSRWTLIEAASSTDYWVRQGRNLTNDDVTVIDRSRFNITFGE